MPFHTTTRLSRHFKPLLVFYLLFVLLCALCQLTGGISWASLTHTTFTHHEYWRLLTAHMIHSSWGHYGFNMAGAGLCLLVFRHDIKLKDWVLSALLISLFSSLCMLFFHTFEGRYLGFSDTLYGWILLGILAILPKERLLGLALLVLLVGRIAYEYIFPGSPFDAILGGAKVAKASHLFGLLGGVLYAFVFFRYYRVKLLRCFGF